MSLNDSSLISAVMNFVKEHMRNFDGSHDYSHIERVVAFAYKILAAEQRDNPQIVYNPTIVILGALLHDAADHKYAHLLQQSSGIVKDAQEKPDSTTSNNTPSSGDTIDAQKKKKEPHSFIYNTPPSGATKNAQEQIDPTTFIYKTLLSLKASSTLATTMQMIVLHVSLSLERDEPEKVQKVLLKYPEHGIIQDADRLDAIGLTGMVRAMIFGGIRGRPTGMQGGIDYVYYERAPHIMEVMKTAEGKRLAKAKIKAGKAFKELWDEEAEEVK